MNGIICIDKPQGFTSFDVVAKMRGISGVRKIGHGGTLDPMATGVLPLFFGTATGAVDRMEQADKEYLATFVLGMTTDTLDTTGKVLTTSPVAVTKQQVHDTAMSFLGKTKQVPPMYSAVKIDGKRLYDLARQGKEVERKSRPIEIYSLQLTPCEQPNTYQILVHCSKGTYVRSLIDDIGQKLGCGAVMSALVRTKSGPFSLSDCLSLQQVQQDSTLLQQRLIPTHRMFETMPIVVLDSHKAHLFVNGVRLRADQVKDAVPKTMCAVYNKGGVFLGLARLCEQEFILEKLFYRRDQ